MPIDPVAAQVIELIDAVYPRVDDGRSAPELRAAMAALPKLPVVDEIDRVEDRTIPGPAGDIPVRVYTPAGDAARPGFVYLHGGGFVIGGLDSHDGASRRLATALGAVVVSVDYRMAPEHPYPAAADDAYAAAVWVAQHADELGFDAARLAVAGDSAGGNLAAVTALRARDLGGPAIAFQLLVYPVADNGATRLDHASKTENAVGYFLTTSQMEWYRDQYVRDDADGEEAYCSPVNAADLTGLPAACVVTAEMDILRDEGEHYARLLEEAGVPVTHHRADGMFHGFFNMDAALDGAKEAQIVAFDAARAALA